MPKHTLYFSQTVYDRLDVDPAGVEGLSARVSNLCVTALETMREAVPAMPLNEWQCLLDVSNGHFRQTDMSLRDQVGGFIFSVSESGPECNEKWSVNCPALARKIESMTLGQQCAIMEVCRRFWVRKDINDKYDSYKDILLAHGAKLPEKTT